MTGKVKTASVAFIQMCAGTDVEANIERAHQMTARALARGAELVVLPERFAANRDGAPLAADAERTARGLGVFAALARRHGAYVVAGSTPRRAPDGKFTNRSTVFGPLGRPVAVYDKLHLFDAHLPGGRCMCESRRFKPGRRTVSFKTPFAEVGLAICFDLRFPEPFRRLAGRGVSVFAVPAAFTAPTGRQHWELLLRARAADSQSFVIGANQFGRSPAGVDLFGNSMIVDPRGHVLARARTTEAVMITRIDLECVTETRRILPILPIPRKGDK